MFETDSNLQWELLALRLVGRLSRESLENPSSDFRSAHSSSSIFGGIFAGRVVGRTVGSVQPPVSWKGYKQRVVVR